MDYYLGNLMRANRWSYIKELVSNGQITEETVLESLKLNNNINYYCAYAMFTSNIATHVALATDVLDQNTDRLTKLLTSMSEVSIEVIISKLAQEGRNDLLVSIFEDCNVNCLIAEQLRQEGKITDAINANTIVAMITLKYLQISNNLNLVTPLYDSLHEEIRQGVDGVKEQGKGRVR